MTLKVAICLAAVITCALCAKLNIQYPGLLRHGPGVGDQQLMSTSNPAEDIPLSVSMKFYGQEYEQICVSDNGFVSFGVRESSNSPRPFPIQPGPGVSFNLLKTPMAAACWSNVDLRCGGEVFFREEVAPDTDLDDVRELVEASGLGSAASFTPKSAVIVTYKDVGPERASLAECASKPTSPRNVYQLILTTDEISTYAIFIYDTLQWDTGNGRGPATSGFNAGNRVDGMSLTPEPESVYVFQVNLGQSVDVMVKLEAEMMMNYALSSNFGVAETESYPEDLPMFEGYKKPLPEAHSSYYPAMTQEFGECELYPFGPSSGDESLWGSDTSTGRQYLQKPIMFYGKPQTTVVGYINGYITFEDFFTAPFPPKELTKISAPSVCPYYADADARGVGSGRMYWRETTNSILLERARIEISDAFNTDFTPDTLFIVTWDHVGYNYYHNERQNTFQAVVASDDQIAYVLFLYKNMQWTSPDGCLTPDNQVVKGGLGADSSFLPVAGICDGETHHQDLLSKPRTQWTDDDYLQLPVKAGNTGLSGMYAFCASENAVTSQKSSYVSSKTQSHAVDPKTSFVLQQAEAQHNSHRPSRPYVSQQWRDDVDALASELGH